MYHKELHFAPGDLVVIKGIRGTVHSIAQCMEYDIILHPENGGHHQHIYLKHDEIKDVELIKPSFESIIQQINALQGTLNKIKNNLYVHNRKDIYAVLDEINNILYKKEQLYC